MTSRQLNAVFMLFKWVLCAIAVYVLSCLPCFAQFGVEQPMFAMPLTTTYADLGFNDPKVIAWWHAEDLAEGQFTTWTARVSGIVLKDGQYAACLKSNNYFMGGSSSSASLLTNDLPWNLNMGGNQSYGFAVICSFSNWVTSVMDIRGDAGGSVPDFYYQINGGHAQYSMTPPGTTVAVNFDWALNGAWHDFVLTCYDLHWLTYTNAAQSWSGVLGAQQDWGNILYFWIKSSGKIRDIIVYTNQVSAYSLSNLHWWRTNYYGP